MSHLLGAVFKSNVKQYNISCVWCYFSSINFKIFYPKELIVQINYDSKT